MSRLNYDERESLMGLGGSARHDAEASADCPEKKKKEKTKKSRLFGSKEALFRGNTFKTGESVVIYPVRLHAFLTY